jgi:hypothetical protein
MVVRGGGGGVVVGATTAAVAVGSVVVVPLASRLSQVVIVGHWRWWCDTPREAQLTGEEVQLAREVT